MSSAGFPLFAHSSPPSFNASTLVRKQKWKGESHEVDEDLEPGGRRDARRPSLPRYAQSAAKPVKTTAKPAVAFAPVASNKTGFASLPANHVLISTPSGLLGAAESEGKTISLTFPAGTQVDTLRAVLNGKDVSSRFTATECATSGYVCATGSLSDADGVRAGKNVLFATVKKEDGTMASSRLRFARIVLAVWQRAPRCGLVNGTAQRRCAQQWHRRHLLHSSRRRGEDPDARRLERQYALDRCWRRADFPARMTHLAPSTLLTWWWCLIARLCRR